MKRTDWKNFMFYFCLLLNAFLLGFSLRFDDNILFKIASVSTVALLLSKVISVYVKEEENKQHY